MSVPEALHCGVYGYLNKPFRAAELELILLRLAERQASHSFQDAASGLYHRTGFAGNMLQGSLHPFGVDLLPVEHRLRTIKNPGQ